MPLEKLSHPLFERACQSLRPSYTPCAPATAKSTYIEILISKEDEKLMDELNGKKVQVMMDKSDDNGKHPVVHVVVVCNVGTRLFIINQVYQLQQML